MDVSRRRLLVLGGSGLAGTVGGCLQFSDPSEQTATGGGNTTATATSTPNADDPEQLLDDYTLAYLDDESVESVTDRTGEDSADITVGGGDDHLSFDPVILRVTVGTTVRWDWSGDGGGHSIVSDGDGPLDSGSPTTGGGINYEYTFESAGTYRYYCAPHGNLGGRGVVVVEPAE